MDRFLEAADLAEHSQSPVAHQLQFFFYLAFSLGNGSQDVLVIQHKKTGRRSIYGTPTALTR
jgi:hypothetical protein